MTHKIRYYLIKIISRILFSKLFFNFMSGCMIKIYEHNIILNNIDFELTNIYTIFIFWFQPKEH